MTTRNVRAYRPRLAKTPHNFKILFDDGTVVDLFEDHQVTSMVDIDGGAELELLTETREEADGHFYMGERRSGRVLTPVLTFLSIDYQNQLLRHAEISRLFALHRGFYIIRDLEPTKRIRARRSGEMKFSFESGGISQLELTLICDSPYWESIATTENFNPNDGRWGYGNMLDVGVNPIYETTSNRLDVYNFGTATIHMLDELTPLRIEIQGATNNLRIVNEATGDVWQYYGATTGIDTIVLDGAVYKKNNQSIFPQTNRKFIRFLPGLNRLRITGSASAVIKVVFRFYYE